MSEPPIVTKSSFNRIIKAREALYPCVNELREALVEFASSHGIDNMEIKEIQANYSISELVKLANYWDKVRS